MRRQWAVVALLMVAVFLAFLTISYYIFITFFRSPPESEIVQQESPVEPEEAAPEARGVLIATRYLPVGALLGEADMVSDTLEIGRIPAGAVTDSDGGDLIGAAVRVSIEAGAPMLSTDLVLPGARGFLSLILSPGMRAVSVNIGQSTAEAGLIDPGDRVDVIFTASAPPVERFEVGELLRATGGGELSRVVFEDLRVLAIDSTVRPQAVGGEEPEERQRIFTATLEIPPAQAPALVHANRTGQLALMVRAARPAPAPASPPPAVHVQDLLLPDARPASPAVALPKVVKIYRPGSESDVVFPDTGSPREDRILLPAPSPPVPFPPFSPFPPFPPSEDPS